MRRVKMIPVIILCLLLLGCSKVGEEALASDESQIDSNNVLDIENDTHEIELHSSAQENEADDMFPQKNIQSVYELYSDKIGAIEESSDPERVRYMFADLDSDGKDEILFAVGDFHISPIYIFTEMDEDWNYYGYFGETGALRYLSGGNVLEAGFGNQGYFMCVFLRMQDSGFEIVGTSIDAYRANGDRVIAIDYPVPDVTGGLSMVEMSTYSFDEEAYSCSEAEYNDYMDQIQSRMEWKRVAYEDMTPLYGE